MSKSVQIHMPQPCHENWHNMTPKEQGRFCGSCQKTVVDFSAMSDKEMLDHFAKAAGKSMCGHFSNEQLNRKITVTKKKRFSWAYIWNLLLATFLVTESYAQEEQIARKKPEVQLPDTSPRVGTFAVKEPDTIPSKEISGTIIDENSKEPLAGATVMVKGTAKGAVTDSLGRFKIMVENTSGVTLVVTFVGYDTQTVVMNKKKNWQKIKVPMKVYEGMSTGVIVIAHDEN